MTYADRLRRKAARLEGWAEGREQKSGAAFDAAHAAVEHIPPGQPVLLGHHSQRSHEAALDKRDRKMGEAIEHAETAERFTRRATRATRHADAIDAQDALALEPYKVGDHVRCVFTNSNRIYRYDGEIVDYTLNFWKVRAFVSPYPGEEPGRIYHAPRKGRPGHTANNRIEEIAP